MTMQPRVSEFSAISAALMTCWYHSGKSSARVGVIAVLGADMVAGAIGITGKPLEHQKMTEFGQNRDIPPPKKSPEIQDLELWKFDREGLNPLNFSTKPKSLSA